MGITIHDLVRHIDVMVKETSLRIPCRHLSTYWIEFHVRNDDKLSLRFLCGSRGRITTCPGGRSPDTATVSPITISTWTMKAALYHLVLLYSLSSACGEARNRVQASRSWTKPLQPRSIPAISVKRFQKGSRSSRQVVLASFKKAGNIAGDLLSKSGASSILANPGFYYGLREELLTHNAGGVRMTNKLDSAMNELKGMRREISQLKKEMIALRRRLGDNVEDLDEGDGVMVLRKRQREFDQIANEIEKWAENLLFGKGKDEGWQEVNGWNMYNKDGRTKCYLKWMKDSRGKNADQSDSNVYPCLKLYATLDASLDDVCAYLADEKNMKEYNDLVVKVSEVGNQNSNQSAIF